jgi:putative endopeptidase
MRQLRLLLGMAGAVITALGTGCTAGGGARPVNSAAPRLNAAAPAAAAIRGLDPGDMDPSAPPCGDFYRYADGGWVKKNPIPADYPSWGAFNELDERNRETLHQTLEKLAAGAPAAPGSEERKLGDFYASCMDEAAIEAAGISPLQGAQMNQLSATGDAQEEIGRLRARRQRALPVRLRKKTAEFKPR